MRLFQILLLVFTSASFGLFAQGDDCSNATDLGSLPTPASCTGLGNGLGSVITTSGTSIGSTAGNPYVYMTDCGTGTTDMAQGANDVWYSFIATGTILELNLSSAFANPNVGLWSGNCLNLVGRGCVIGDAAGNINATVFEPLTPGETYYVQISGNFPFSQGTFSLELNNNNDCSDCLQGGVLTANPPPINGTYAADQTVEFCYTLTDYDAVSANWLHAVQVEWSAGWVTTPANVVTTSPPACNSAGNWAWNPNGVGLVNGVNWPAGFYFNNLLTAGWGDSDAQACDPQFCWSLTTLPISLCSSSTPLSVTVNTSADGESGSWTSPACQDDPSTVFESVLSCCSSPPTMSSTNVSCGSGASDGTATIQTTGFALPWTYQWYDDTGVLISTTSFSSSNTNTLSNLAAGSYTAVVIDNTGCSVGNTVVVNAPTATEPTFSFIPYICAGEPLSLPSVSNDGVSGTWSPAIDNTITTSYTFTPDPGECALPTSTTVVVRPAPTIDPLADITQCNGLPIDLTAIISGLGPSIAWSSPGGSFSNPNSTTTTFTPSISNGSVTITAVVSSVICTITNQEEFIVNLTESIIPSFTPIVDICSGDALSLPATSTNSISGTWSPAVDNTSTTTYTFTPDGGQCATTEVLTVNVNAQSTPSFTPIADICSGDALSLPATSTNSISGTWSPAVDNTSTTTYTFTPDGGQCATTGDLTVNVNAQITPSFTPIADICSGDALSLPATSTNSISGTWSPAVDNTSTTTYTFTPDGGQCATTEDLTVNVNAQSTPNFTPIADICSGDALSLPATSTNSISGTWSPAVDNTTTTTYTFTPDGGQCATSQDLTVSVNNQIPPIFTQILAACNGDLISLPLTSTNSISGTWSPAVDNTTTTTYTFTPDGGQCATIETMTVDVNTETNPSFTPIADICSGDALSLPATSTNSISGTWSPAVDNTSTTTYTFTPDGGQCATTEDLTVNVNAQSTPSFTPIADICSGDALSLPATSTNSISGTWSPAVDNTSTTTYTFTPDGGQCATTEDLTVNVNAQSTPNFTPIADICSGDALSLPATSTNSISGTWSPAVDNTTTTTYTFTPDGGQCATTEDLTVNVNAQSTPNFTPIADICSGDALSLPATSTNSISGTWSPAVDNTSTTTYTFTPDGGQCATTEDLTVNVNAQSQCATTEDLTVNVNAQSTPSFTPIADICSGDALSLPATSTNSISGTWSPAVDNTSTTTYTFTPDGGQCATTEDLTVNVNAQSTPSFSPIADICSGDALSLPATSTNSISGTWSPAVDNTTTTTYTFTPDGGQCATIETMTVDVNTETNPSFTPIADICSGDALSLPATSTNSISGTWSPAVDNTTTTTYTFTPDGGQCATIETMTVNVNAQSTPSFSPIADICSGDALSLPATSTNSISGTWSPAVDNTTTTTYTFTPDGGQCATIETMTVDVNTETNPSFTPIADICSGDALSLPATSTNSISGTWSPAVDNTSTTTYTFTPDGGQCATIETMTVNVNAQSTPSFSPIADICSGDALSLPATSTNSISGTWSPAVDNTSTTTYTFTPDGGQCATIETMTVDVNTQSTPSFTPIADICSGDALSLPATSTNSISGTWSPAVDNTTTTTYTFTPDGGQCATTGDLTVNVNAIPQFNNSVLNDPSSCGGNDGSILIDGLLTSSTYDLSYNDGVSNIGPFSITTDASGEAILTGLGAGAYSSFMISDGNCSFTVVASVNLTDPSAPAFVVSGSTDPSICGGTDGEVILTGLLSNTFYSLSYLDGGVSVGPINISSDVSGKIEISNLDAGVYSAFVLDLAGCTGSTPSSITLVDPSIPVLQITDPLAVCTPGTVDLSLADVTAGSTGGGVLSYWVDAAATIPLADQSAVTSSGTYYIQSEINGCIDIEAVNVVVNQTPDIQITDPLAVCTPGTVDLSLADVTAGSTGGGVLSYWMDAAATMPLANQSALTSSGTYYIQSESNGCIDIEAVNVVVNQTPSFTVSGTDPSVCNAVDGLITFTGLNPSTDYTLSYDSLEISSQTTSITSDASGSFVLNGLVAGLYDVFSISLNGCAFTAAENIDLNNPSAPSLDFQLDTTVCDTYTLEVITGSNLSGNEAYYSQSNGAGTPLNIGDPITVSQTVYIYDNIGACSDEASFALTVNTTPQITNLPAQESCVDYSLPVIEGTNLTGNENYYTDAQANGGATITNPITTSQTVFIYDASGACSDEVSFEVIIYDLPEVLSFSGEGTYCEGDAIDPLNVEVNGVGEFTLDYTLDGVNNSETTNMTSITLGSAPGVYVLTQITDAHCSNTSALTQTITVNATPATPSTSGDAEYCANEVAQDIEADGSTGSYTWYADQNLTEVIGSQQQYTPENIMGSTSYYVTATENGCEGLPQMIMIVFQECGIIIPTAFTPDGDQTNDTWRLENIDAIYPNNIVSVYNRLGNKVFEAQKGSYNQMPWDGTFNGQELPVASYYYIIEYNDNTTENSNGIITIVK